MCLLSTTHRIIVSEADVVENCNLPADSFKECRQQRFGIQVWGLDENSLFGIPNGREECLILRSMYAGMVWSCHGSQHNLPTSSLTCLTSPGFSTDHSHWHGFVRRMWNQRRHFQPWFTFGCITGSVLL